jgi:hypothetical protein
MHTLRSGPFFLKFLSLYPLRKNHRRGGTCFQKLDQKAIVFDSAEASASGVCTNRSTAPPEDETRRVSGGAATTSRASDERRFGCSDAIAGQEVTTHDFRASFTASLLRHLGAALRRERSADDRLLRVHIGNGGSIGRERTAVRERLKNNSPALLQHVLDGNSQKQALFVVREPDRTVTKANGIPALADPLPHDLVCRGINTSERNA